MIAVTKLIDLLNKPALVYWANSLGLKGITLNDYYKEVKSDGNKKHNEVEDYLKNGVLFEGHEILSANLEGYEVLGIEQSLSNDFLTARADLRLKKDGKTYVVDLKRNKKIYLGTKLQLSAYKHIFNDDYVCYMNFDSYKLEILNIDTSKYYEMLKRLYQVNELLKCLNENL